MALLQSNKTEIAFRAYLFLWIKAQIHLPYHESVCVCVRESVPKDTKQPGSSAFLNSPNLSIL